MEQYGFAVSNCHEYPYRHLEESMKKLQCFDIFISYRREGGYDTAQLLYDRLTQMRYRVSFDLETLRGGKFNTQLYKRIEQCSDVLVVMSKDSLNLRENPDDDWFRLEIAHALKHKKNIVPVFLRDFKFPQKGDLPPDIADLVDYQGVTASQEHFDSVLQRICRNFKSKPRRRIGLMAGVVAIGLLVMAGVGIGFNADKIFPYPFTNAAKQEVASFCGVVSQLSAAYNDFLSAKAAFIRDGVRLSIKSGNPSEYESAIPQFMHQLAETKRRFGSAVEALERIVKENSGLRVDRAYIPNFIEGLREEFNTAGELIALFKLPCDPNYPCSKANRIRLVDLKEREIGIYAEFFAYGIMALFAEVSPDAKDLADFREVAAKQWMSLGRFRGEWLSDQKQIENNAEAVLNQLQEVVNEQSQIIGNASRELEQARRDGQKKLIDMGATPEAAERIQGKIEKVSNLKARLDETEKQLAAARERIRKKFAPKDDDDIGILWGKALRFMKAGMSEEAKLCITALRKRNAAEFPPAALDAAEAFFASDVMPQTGGGLLVCSFEPPAICHAIFCIGDIVTSMDGNPCCKFEDYRAKTGSEYAFYRRDEQGKFVKMSAKMPEGQPRVALANLAEEPE